MKPTEVTYPIDSGLVWLAERGGSLAGWRGEFSVGNGDRRLVAIIRHTEELVKKIYHVYFYFPGLVLDLKRDIIPSQDLYLQDSSFVESRVKLLHRLSCSDGARPTYFNFWGVSEERLDDFDREYLPQLLKGDLVLREHALPEPLVFLGRGTEAA